jgi:hypothetical protein
MISATEKTRCPRRHLRWTDSSSTLYDPDTGKDFRNLRRILTAIITGLVGTIIIQFSTRRLVRISNVKEKALAASGILMILSSVVTILSTSIIEYGMMKRQSHWCERCRLRWDIESYPERFPNPYSDV